MDNRKYGKGVTADWSEARKWYKEAADQGYELAKNNLKNAQCCVML